MLITLAPFLLPPLVIFSLLYAVLFPPRWILSQLAAASGVRFFFDTNGKKLLCLTIDDAPSSGTPELLVNLQHLGVPATFFIIGNSAISKPEIISSILKNGHEICNHDLIDRKSATVPESDLQAAMRLTHDTLESHLCTNNYSEEQTSSSSSTLVTSPSIQSCIRWFRPGGGFFNSSVLACCRRMGYECVLGDVYSHDCLVPFPWFIIPHMKYLTQPGSIVILHDGSVNRTRVTTKVLQSLVPYLQENGYTIVTLSKMQEAVR